MSGQYLPRRSRVICGLLALLVVVLTVALMIRIATSPA